VDSSQDKNFSPVKPVTPGKKGKGCLIAIVVVLMLMVVTVLFFILNRENFRSYLENAPLIGALFSVLEEEIDPLYTMTDDEMRIEILNLRNENDSLRNQRDEAAAQLTSANELNRHLTTFQTRWNEYRRASATFTQMLAHNDPINFVDFFEDIVNHDLVPQDILAAAFAEAQAINVYDEELRMLVSTYNNMEAGNAAEAIERLRLTHTQLAVRMLRAMGNSRRGEIFDEMEANVSSAFTILLSTEPPTFAPLVPPPALPEISPLVPPRPTPPPPIEEDDDDDGEDEGDAEEEIDEEDDE
jgi:FtsZ-binding cell division protein ZapB